MSDNGVDSSCLQWPLIRLPIVALKEAKCLSLSPPFTDAADYVMTHSLSLKRLSVAEYIFGAPVGHLYFWQLGVRKKRYINK